MTFIKMLWRGELSLPFTYWVMGSLFTVVLSLPMTVLDSWKPNGEFTKFEAQIYWSSAVLSLLYFPFITVGIWRSALKYIEAAKRSVGKVQKKPFWGYIAMFMVVVGWSQVFSAFTEGFATNSGTEDNQISSSQVETPVVNDSEDGLKTSVYLSQDNWTTYSYEYGTGGFSHCAAVREYENGDFLVLGLNKYTGSLGVGSTRWSLQDGEVYPVYAQVDELQAFEYESVVTLAGAMAHIESIESVLMDQISRGTELYIHTESQTLSYSLSSSDQAQEALKKCFNDGVAATEEINPFVSSADTPPNPFLSGTREREGATLRNREPSQVMDLEVFKSFATSIIEGVFEVDPADFVIKKSEAPFGDYQVDLGSVVLWYWEEEQSDGGSLSSLQAQLNILQSSCDGKSGIAIEPSETNDAYDVVSGAYTCEYSDMTTTYVSVSVISDGSDVLGFMTVGDLEQVDSLELVTETFMDTMVEILNSPDE